MDIEKLHIFDLKLNKDQENPSKLPPTILRSTPLSGHVTVSNCFTVKQDFSVQTCSLHHYHLTLDVGTYVTTVLQTSRSTIAFPRSDLHVHVSIPESLAITSGKVNPLEWTGTLVLPHHLCCLQIVILPSVSL